MRHPEWLLQLCVIWCFMKITKTCGEVVSKKTIFQLHKHPAVSVDDGDVIKNISKICYDNNDTHDETGIETLNFSNENDTKILNILKKILQQIQRSQCRRTEKKQVQKEPEADIHFVTKQREEEKREIQYEGQQPFNIFQQLRLEEQTKKWQQQEQQQQEKQLILQQQQQNALKLQHIMQHLAEESLGKAGKKQKKKKKKKRKRKKPDKNKKKKPIKLGTSLHAQPAHILFASATQNPSHYYHQAATTKKPYLEHPLIPIKKIKYILRKNTIFKKKKKEYLNHLKHVFYPFVKFIAFFTIINPFTLAVFLFSLISPVLFGFIGFVGLSIFIKPALNLLFGVKHTINAINRRKLQELRKRQRLRNSLRPITIHKHYYQQRPIKMLSAPKHHYRPSFDLKPKGPIPHSPSLGNHHHHASEIKFVNPLLPDVRQKLKKDNHFIPDIKRYNDSFERFWEYVY